MTTNENIKRNKMNSNTDTGSDEKNNFSNLSPTQLLKALRAFDHGDFAVADTVNARQLLKALRAYNSGNFQTRLPEDLTGISGEISTTFNEIVSRHEKLLKEFTKANKAVGKNGKLSQRVEVESAPGGWGENIKSFNTIIDDLIQPIDEIAEVIGAVSKGDLGQKMEINKEGRLLKGEFLRVAKLTNNMIDQFDNFSSEVTRVAKEVGTDGILGGKADVKGVSGVWKDLTINVNDMADNLTTQVRDVIKVTTAVAQGDLTQKMSAEAKGEILDLKSTINGMVDFLYNFSGEVTRVAREVGTDGTLGGQADVRGVTGSWKDLTENVNTMATNLTNQVRDISHVVVAIADGDLTKKITVDAEGETLKLKNRINGMVSQLGVFSEEVTRISKEVGTDGTLGGQADVKGVSGVWKGLTDSVNLMATNLTLQVRDIATVTKAIAEGDLTQKIRIDAKGEVLELKNTINTMVSKLNSFSTEVTQLAQEVGTEGKLGGQAKVEGVKGAWRDLTSSVNTMASNLTSQVRDVVHVITAVSKGDLTQQVNIEAKGEVLGLKNTINTMVDQLETFTLQVTQVATEVGSEGKLGGQAVVVGAAGTWKQLTDSVNIMANNLTAQVRDILVVTSAISVGDLSKRISVDVKGEVLDLKNAIDLTTDVLSTFSKEVTRVANEVGVQGKLGGQADIPDAQGTWKELTNNVNLMAQNLTDQVRDIAEVTTAVAQGDLTKKITVEAKGETQKLKETINLMVDQLSNFSGEVTRISKEVGSDGILGSQARVEGVSGTWKVLTDNVNTMAQNLTEQVRDIAMVVTAVADGDLTKKISVEVKGETFKLKENINIMIDQLASFASEVTRVAKEVGTDGILGGQAEVKGVGGIWKELTDNVNKLAYNLTEQVRSISEVVKATADGDLNQKIVIDAKGEMADLKDTINNMNETLKVFADEVVVVARDVGIDGVLGGQAEVPGVQGTWKELTDNVNELATNLTTQVRAIGDVAEAVTKGDLTQRVDVDARGEVSDLRDNINTMVATLAESTINTSEQDWLKSNLTKFNTIMQGKRDLSELIHSILSELCSEINAKHGAFYMMGNSGSRGYDEGSNIKEVGESVLTLISGYGYKERKGLSNNFKLGEGLVGQCALEKELILISDVPSDYIKINSGLGEVNPSYIIVLPIIFEGEVKGVIELASLDKFTEIQKAFFEQFTSAIGVVMTSVQANGLSESLLKESQTLSEELQTQQKELKDTNEKLEVQASTLKQSEYKLKTQQEELQQTNEELEDKANMLALQKTQVELKNTEVEQAKEALEQKAEQLTLTSRYKSEFLANMSHELRTPLNSLLILSEVFKKNKEDNLTAKQIESISIINNSGTELLNLINEILDLAKIESGTMAIDISDINFKNLKEWAMQGFDQFAINKGIQFEFSLGNSLPKSFQTDFQRLQQVLKNLLSNAFKFTEKGTITLGVSVVTEGWDPGNAILRQANQVVAFSVKDTGIGITPEKQKIIFEAFQQADGTTSRKYGGTGLGLSISREISKLLGGEIQLVSESNVGSTFTFYLPLISQAPENQGESDNRTEKINTSYQLLPQINLKSDQAEITDLATSLIISEIVDDREEILENDRIILIVEDDDQFAQILLDQVREQGFRGLVALTGEGGLGLAREFKPDAIILDIKLPCINGRRVLDLLKQDPETRHIPVHITSDPEARKRSLKSGAIYFLQKPIEENKLISIFTEIKGFIEKGSRRLLIVEDDAKQRKYLTELIGSGDVIVTAVGTGKEALKELQNGMFDCMVLDLLLPDTTGFQLIEEIKNRKELINLPIIIYTGRELSKEDETKLSRVAETIIFKDVGSPESLVDETALFLNRVEGNIPESKRKVLVQGHDVDPVLLGRKVLIVDDDMRNIFALSSVLEGHEMKVFHAESGQDGLDLLASNGDIEIVLMDIMMPGLDGYETMRRIRKMKQYQKLPVIAVTAKAMKEDREKCIQAGATDYITKPVNTAKLLSILRVSLYK
jgi:CheY-like chemotaxis protein